MPEILCMQRNLHFYFSKHSCFFNTTHDKFSKKKVDMWAKIKLMIFRINLILYSLYHSTFHFFETEPDNFDFITKYTQVDSLHTWNPLYERHLHTYLSKHFWFFHHYNLWQIFKKIGAKSKLKIMVFNWGGIIWLKGLWNKSNKSIPFYTRIS